MSAIILPFRPRPNPKRDAEQLTVAMFQATWAPFFAWMGHNEKILARLRGVPAQPGTYESDADPQNPNITAAELYARGLAIDTDEKEPT